MSSESNTVKSVLRDAWGDVAALPRRLSPRNLRLMRVFATSPPPRRLHLGCGPHILPGWLNTDRRTSTDVAYLDMTRPFPLASGTVDYVFNEHCIEHISYARAVAMLREAFRVLRPGGQIRVVTPDFTFLKGLHGPDRSPLQQAYLEWASRDYPEETTSSSADIHLINRFFRAWGHKFIHDRNSLTEALRTAGFSDMRQCAINESADPQLAGLENAQRMPDGFLQLESLVMEATKAAG